MDRPRTCLRAFATVTVMWVPLQFPFVSLATDAITILLDGALAAALVASHLV